MQPKIEQSTVVITGASSGFGRGAALKLASLGAKVIISARRMDVLEEVAGEATSKGGFVIPVQGDVSDPANAPKLMREALGISRAVDIWINNVGVGALGFFWDIPIEDHRRLVDVNLTGLIYGSHAAINQFRLQNHGILINLGSVDSEIPLAFQSSYAATKAAVLSLGRSLNEELRIAGYDNIKTSTIMPWAVDTPWWNHAANYTGHEPRMAAMDDPSIVVDAIVEACSNPKEEIPVGWKAGVSTTSHRLFPGLTERLTANTAAKEITKAELLPPHTGSLFEPMPEGTTIEGGIRQRMRKEDGQKCL